MNGITIWSFLIGVIIGALCAWILLNQKLRAADSSFHKEKLEGAKLLSDEQSSRSLLTANLQARDEQLEELRRSAGASAAEIKSLNEQLNSRIERCSSAEAKIARIPALELALETKDAKTESLLKEIQTLNVKVQEASTKLEEERKAGAERLALLNDAQTKLSDAFKALSSEALQFNNTSFLELANLHFSKLQEGAAQDLEHRKKSIDELVKPLKDGLDNVDKKVQELDKARIQSDATLKEQISQLTIVQTNLQGETQNLVKALRNPSVRGRWGEMLLRRVVELAGMQDHCSFDEQVSVTVDGETFRPDLLIRLPEKKCVIVDSKVPLESYMNAVDSTDEATTRAYLEAHARVVKQHIIDLAKKKYWEKFPEAMPTVVMFLPGEALFSAALEQDRGLIDFAAERKVMLATPTTLISLLTAINYGWTQDQLSQNAAEISRRGKDLYDRVQIFAGHFSDLRKNLAKTVESHNKIVGSLENRVLPAARKFRDLTASDGKEIEVVEAIDVQPRMMHEAEAVVLQLEKQARLTASSVEESLTENAVLTD